MSTLSCWIQRFWYHDLCCSTSISQPLPQLLNKATKRRLLTVPAVHLSLTESYKIRSLIRSFPDCKSKCKLTAETIWHNWTNTNSIERLLTGTGPNSSWGIDCILSADTIAVYSSWYSDMDSDCRRFGVGIGASASLLLFDSGTSRVLWVIVTMWGRFPKCIPQVLNSALFGRSWIERQVYPTSAEFSTPQ